MTVIIREVQTKKDLDVFIHLPFKIFKDNQYWIPPLLMDEYNTLDMKKNPASSYCKVKYFIAYINNEPVGRIAGIINERFIEKWQKKYIRFDWIDFVDDYAVAEALLDSVMEWGIAEGMEGMNGPLGFTDLDPEGLLIEGFEELGTLPMIYNHPYYPKYLEQWGLRKDVDWYEFEVKVPEALPDKIERVENIVFEKTGLKLLKAKGKNDLLKYVDGIFDVINESYSDLYGTVELDEKQIEVYTKQYFGFIDPDFVKIIIDDNNEVQAFGIAMPSLSRALQRSKGRIFPFGWIHLLWALKKPKYIDLYLVGVRNKYRNMGLNAVLMAEINRSCIKRGIVSAETSGELETNTNVQSFWKYFDRRHHKTRRAYMRLFGEDGV